MTRRLVGVLVAAAFVVGFLSGAAGTIVAHDNTPNRDLVATMADHLAGYDMDSMMSSSTGAMMSGSMMGPGASSGPSMMSSPAAGSMPGSQHDLHHPAASQDGVR